MNLLVSACLLGVDCRYKGDAKANPAVIALRGKYNLIPVCPEQLGGLPTPRLPAEPMQHNLGLSILSAQLFHHQADAWVS